MADQFDGTCAGMRAKTAMYPFSSDLMMGCEQFAALSQSSQDSDDTRRLNAACAMFAASAIEARLNEWVAVARQIDGAPPSTAFWDEMAAVQRALPLERKWNLIASVHGGAIWDSSKDPFHSYETIVALRNELVHFKGKFLEKDHAPSNRIRHLMSQFKISSEATFVEGDVSSWVCDLLEQRGLGSWIVSKVKPFYGGLLELLLGSPSKPMRAMCEDARA